MKYLLSALIFLLSASAFGQNSTKDQLPPFRVAEKILKTNSSYNFYGEPVSLIIETRNETQEDGLFYYFLGLVLYIALIRIIFYRYMSLMFTLFFRGTLRQQQLREQLLQSPLPGLLLNIFFAVSAGTYLTLLGEYYYLPSKNFWATLLSATTVVAAVYLGKYMLLNIAGWIFGIRHVAEAYIFSVMLINKMLGIFLLPVIILMAFPNPALLPTVVTLSYILLACMALYRVVLSYRPVRVEIKLTGLHFFLYLCAFEIAPLLLIYKVLLSYMYSRLY